jgi:hypothetical protein
MVAELMLVFQRVPQEGDYWGCVPLNFFARHPNTQAHGIKIPLKGTSDEAAAKVS